MPAPPDFRLYHGNDLGLLAGVLAAELAKPAPRASWLAADTILIPQPAMRRWLQKTLAEAHGVAANLRFLTPGEFVGAALAANLPGDDRAVADAATLRWRLWALLADAQAMAEPVFAPLRPLLAGAGRALAAWALAGELAAAFEKYQAWRRGWLLRWDGGADRDDWQAELWRRATAGRDHRARRLHAYLQAHAGDAPRPPRGLPSRVFAFGCQNVSPDVLRVIASVAHAGELHFFFVSPVASWWGDLPSARARLLADAGGASGDGMFAADADNPLLIANGGAGRDFVNLLFAGDVVHPRGEVAIYVPPARAGLLFELQRDLLARRPPPSAPDNGFDPGDRSLQLHECHTPLREVQVLHEQLRTLLEADPTLQPRDIAVLTPDIDAYAPLVHAVFGGATGTRAIPYAIADGSALASRPLAAWWLQLLALPTARFTLTEGLALLAPAPVLQRLGLDPTTLQRLGEALRDAGARWGRDPAHRRACAAGDAPEYTWQWAIDRLLLGHATGGDGEIAGLVPCPRLDGGDLAALDGLLAGLRALEHCARDLSTARAPGDWPRVLAATLADLLPERAADAGDRRAVDELRALPGALAQELQLARPDADVPGDVIAAWFRDRLGETDTRQPFLTGGVTFARMVPMRMIPFRVICLLGMDDGAYPRRDPGGALNRLAAQLRTPQRQPGDRSVREDDRFLFLQLFAAAGDVLYASWVGRDPRSGEARPPSVVVAELIDVAAQYRADPGAQSPAKQRERVAKRLVVRHPLHPFAAQAFGVAWSDRKDRESAEDAARRRPWQGDWRAAAEAAGGARLPAPAFVDAALPAPAAAIAPMTRDALLQVLRNPPRYFLQQRLDVRLPQPEDPLPASEPFALDDGLHRFALARRVFAALRADDGDDSDALRRRLLAEGLLPPGAAGAELLASARALAGGCARAARRWAADPPRTLAYELVVDGTPLLGRFDAVHDRGLVQFRPGKAHGGAHLEFGIDYLIWHALGETRPVLRLVPGEAPQDLPWLAADTALAALARLLAVARRAAREPLPLLPKSAWAWQQAKAGRDPDKAFAAAAKEWTGGDDGDWAEGRDPWVRLALRGRDPFFDDDGAALATFADLAADVFGALVGADVAETADD